MMRTSTHSRPTRRQAGFSLLEVLIATLVLSAGLLGLAGLQIAGMKTTHNSYQMQQATWLVHDLLERMRVNQVRCGTGTVGGLRNDLMGASLTVTCVGGVCRNGVNINVVWSERNSSSKVGNNTEQSNINLNAVL